MSPFSQIIREGVEEQVETAWQQIITSGDPVAALHDTFGDISVGSNGRLQSERLDSNRPTEEFALLRALSILVAKGALPPVRRLTIQLSADSAFPYFIKPLLDNPVFSTLNLNRFRGKIPRDFWTMCTNFKVQSGQPSWHYQIIAPPNLLGECNFHRLKALATCAKENRNNANTVRTLYLWRQHLTRLPNNLGDLENLERLELWGNPIERFPQSTVMLFMLKDAVFSKEQQPLAEEFHSILPHVRIGWT